MDCTQIQDDDVSNAEEPDMEKKLKNKCNENGVPAEGPLTVTANNSDAKSTLEKVTLLSQNCILCLSF